MYIEDFIAIVTAKLPEGFILHSEHKHGFMFTVTLPDKSVIDLFVTDATFDEKTDKEIIEQFVMRVGQCWDIETL